MPSKDHFDRQPTSNADPPSRRDWLWPIIPVLFFLAMRLPAVFQAAGGQDEEWYGVPGLIVSQTWLPKVPYSRAYEPDSLFWKSDELLFAMPPLSFYAQAPFFLFLPGNYGTARLASVTAGCVAIFVVYSLGISFFQDRRVAFCGSLFYSLSRLFFFPAMSARPDILCGMFGLLAVRCLLNAKSGFCTGDAMDLPDKGISEKRWLTLSGICVGLGGLTHPFAIVFAMQLAPWVALLPGAPIQRVTRLFVFSLGVSVAFALWLPLIAVRPDLFRRQFFANIMDPAGSGFLSRLLMPSAGFYNQIPQLIDRAHPLQFFLIATALLLAGGWLLLRYRSELGICWVLCVSSFYLLIALLGVHPIQGFWCYPSAFAWLCTAYVGFALFDRWIDRGNVGIDIVPRTSRRAFVSVLVVGLLLLLPGSGIRAVVTYWQTWRDPLYSSPLFVRQMLSDLPEDCQLTIGGEYSLDAFATGRKVILGCNTPGYFQSARFPSDYLILGRRDLENGLAKDYRLELVKTYGEKETLFANYAELHRIQARAKFSMQLEE
ncbi:MAG: glycosyltransferase family 39 protein [Pirellulaceae bacterium]|nr:glycosyltransferase family 39 protein [Pirellulaceae bacterium]